MGISHPPIMRAIHNAASLKDPAGDSIGHKNNPEVLCPPVSAGGKNLQRKVIVGLKLQPAFSSNPSFPRVFGAQVIQYSGWESSVGKKGAGGSVKYGQGISLEPACISVC